MYLITIVTAAGLKYKFARYQSQAERWVLAEINSHVNAPKKFSELQEALNWSQESIDKGGASRAYSIKKVEEID